MVKMTALEHRWLRRGSSTVPPDPSITSKVLSRQLPMTLSRAQIVSRVLGKVRQDQPDVSNDDRRVAVELMLGDEEAETDVPTEADAGTQGNAAGANATQWNPDLELELERLQLETAKLMSCRDVFFSAARTGNAPAVRGVDDMARETPVQDEASLNAGCDAERSGLGTGVISRCLLEGCDNIVAPGLCPIEGRPRTACCERHVRLAQIRNSGRDEAVPNAGDGDGAQDNPEAQREDAGSEPFSGALPRRRGGAPLSATAAEALSETAAGGVASGAPDNAHHEDEETEPQAGASPRRRGDVFLSAAATQALSERVIRDVGGGVSSTPNRGGLRGGSPKRGGDVAGAPDGGPAKRVCRMIDVARGSNPFCLSCGAVSAEDSAVCAECAALNAAQQTVGPTFEVTPRRHPAAAHQRGVRQFRAWPSFTSWFKHQPSAAEASRT